MPVGMQLADLPPCANAEHATMHEGMRPDCKLPPRVKKPARAMSGFPRGLLTLALVALPAAIGWAQQSLPTASIVAPPAITEGAPAMFIVSVDPPPANPIDVTLYLSQSGNFASEDDMSRQSLAIGPAGYAHLSVPTSDDGDVAADGQIRAILVGDGYSYVPSKSADSATVQVRDNSGLGRVVLGELPALPAISVTTSRSVAEGAEWAIILTAWPLPDGPLDVTVAIRSGNGASGSDFEDTRTVTLGRDGFARIAEPTVDDAYIEADRLASVRVLPSDTGAYAVNPNAVSAQIEVLDNDRVNAFAPRPTVSIVGPTVAYADNQGDAVFSLILSVNPPPEPEQTITVPLRFSKSDGVEVYLLVDAAHSLGGGVLDNIVPIEVSTDDTETTEDPEDTTEVPPPAILEPIGPVEIESIDIARDGLRYIQVLARLIAEPPATTDVGPVRDGAPNATVGVVIETDAERSFQVSDTNGRTAVRVFDAGKSEHAFPTIRLVAPQSTPEGGLAQFLLFADVGPFDSARPTVTVQVSHTGGALPDTLDCTLVSGTTDQCQVEINRRGWGILSLSTVNDDEGSDDTARVTATILEPADADYARSVSSGSRTIRVMEDDGPAAPLPRVEITSVNEVAAGQRARFLLTATPPPTADMEVRVAITRDGSRDTVDMVDVSVTGLVEEPVLIPGARSISSGVGHKELTVPTRPLQDENKKGTAKVTATILRDDTDPYELANRYSGTITIRDDETADGDPQPPRPRVGIFAPSRIYEGMDAAFLLSAMPESADPIQVPVTVRETGGMYLESYDDPNPDDPDARSFTFDPVLSVTPGQATLYEDEVGTTKDEDHENLGYLNFEVRSPETPGQYTAAPRSAGIRVINDPRATDPPPRVLPKISISPAVPNALPGTHAQFLVSADTGFSDDAPRNVRLVLSATGEHEVDDLMLGLSSPEGCQNLIDYATLRDSGVQIDNTPTYLCVPLTAGMASVRLELATTYEKDNYRLSSAQSATVAVSGLGLENDDTPIVSIYAPRSVAQGALAGFVVAYTANRPLEESGGDIPTVRLRLSGAGFVTTTYDVVLSVHGFAHLTVDPGDANASSITAEFVAPSDGRYRIDPNRAKATIDILDLYAPAQDIRVSITAPASVAQGGTSAFILSAAPAPLPGQTIVAYVAPTANSNVGQRIVPIDSRGVAILPVGAVAGGNFASGGVLRGCLRTDSLGIYATDPPGGACAEIDILDPSSIEDPRRVRLPTVSLTAPRSIGAGTQATLLLSADPAPSAPGFHVGVDVGSSTGGGAVLGPEEAGRHTLFVPPVPEDANAATGSGGIATFKVRTRDAEGVFSVSVAGSEEAAPYRVGAGEVMVDVRKIPAGATPRPVVAVKHGAATATEGDDVRFVIESSPPTPRLVVHYRLDGGDGFVRNNLRRHGTVALDSNGRGIVSIATEDDRQMEPDGSISIRLPTARADEYRVGTSNAHVTILDNGQLGDTTMLSLTSAEHAMEGAPAQFMLTLDPPPQAPSVVEVEIADTSDLVSHRHLGTRRVTVPEQGYIGLSVPTRDDYVAGQGGKVTATIKQPGRGLRIDPDPGSASVVVVDNDAEPNPPRPPTVSLVAPTVAPAASRVALRVVADSLSPYPAPYPLNVRLELSGAASFDPQDTRRDRRVRLDEHGQATVNIWTSKSPDSPSDAPVVDAEVRIVDGRPHYQASRSKGKGTVNIQVRGRN